MSQETAYILKEQTKHFRKTQKKFLATKHKQDKHTRENPQRNVTSNTHLDYILQQEKQTMSTINKLLDTENLPTPLERSAKYQCH